MYVEFIERMRFQTTKVTLTLTSFFNFLQIMWYIINLHWHYNVACLYILYQNIKALYLICERSVSKGTRRCESSCQKFQKFKSMNLLRFIAYPLTDINEVQLIYLSRTQETTSIVTGWNDFNRNCSAIYLWSSVVQSIVLLPMYTNWKYKEGNNRPSSVNQISLVHNHDKAGNKFCTQDNTNTRENISVRIGTREE